MSNQSRQTLSRQTLGRQTLSSIKLVKMIRSCININLFGECMNKKPSNLKTFPSYLYEQTKEGCYKANFLEKLVMGLLVQVSGQFKEHDKHLKNLEEKISHLEKKN